MESAIVRSQILEQHAELRGMLAEISELADRFEAEGETVGEALREHGLALYARFEEHLGFEDRYLAPALRVAHAEGVEAANRLANEHAEQRELLHYLLDRLKHQRQPTQLVVRELRSFAEYLLQDIAHEEEKLLGEDVFRPD
jgi:hemerythrin-like domain-containing protein